MNLRRIVGALGVWVGVCLSANAMAQSSWHRLAQQWTLNDAHEVAVAISGGWVPVGSGSEGDFGQYRGAVVEARPHGEGELKLFSGEWFKGQFVNGWPHGRGRARCESCGEYSGDWQYGLPHGEGQSEDAVGNRYRGQWHEGMRQGRGEWVWASGSSYQGQWHQDKPHGLGRWNKSVGEYYVGDFAHGQPSGYGLLANGDKQQFLGPFEAGQIHGTGPCVRDSVVGQCQFQEGVLTGWVPMTVSPAGGLSWIAVDNSRFILTPVRFESVYWQTQEAMVSKQLKLFTHERLDEGVHWVLDGYDGPGEYELGRGDVVMTPSAQGNAVTVSHLDDVRALIVVESDDGDTIAGSFSVWSGGASAERPLAGVSLRNGRFMAKRWLVEGGFSDDGQL